MTLGHKILSPSGSASTHARLDLVHKKLENSVFEAYEPPIDLSDDHILERLLELNLNRVGQV